MILDSSAVVAVLCREPGHMALLDKIAAARTVFMSAPTVFEAAMVLTIKLRKDGFALVSDFLREANARVVPCAEEHASIAFGAYLRYGKGRHPAALNFGDCFSYAASKAARQPLLFVGADFAKTDVAAA